MPDNLCLLFNAIIGKRLAGDEIVIIAAERMPDERQKNALLMLPDMDHFVDEQALQAKARHTVIIAEQAAFWMEPDIAIGGHRHAAGVKGPPFAVEYPHASVIDCISENGPAQGYLACGERAALFMRVGWVANIGANNGGIRNCHLTRVVGFFFIGFFFFAIIFSGGCGSADLVNHGIDLNPVII